MLLMYSSEEMFNLVEDIESYPLFLPWCKKTLIRLRNEKKTIAALTIEHLGIEVSFMTENEKEFPKKMILKLVEGPFRRFEGAWLFKSLAEKACRVDFQLEYEFSNRMLDKPLSLIFGQFADKIADAFVKRAQSIYGNQKI